MKSRVHPRYKTKYRVGNWPAYDRALVQRGDVTLWLTPEAIATWEAVGIGKRGGQLQYSEVAIETALTLRLIFHLPLRQTEGFLRSIFGMLCLDLSAPDHTTLSRRGQHLDLALRRLPAGAGIHLIVDSTGLSTVADPGQRLMKVNVGFLGGTLVEQSGRERCQTPLPGRVGGRPGWYQKTKREHRGSTVGRRPHADAVFQGREAKGRGPKGRGLTQPRQLRAVDVRHDTSTGTESGNAVEAPQPMGSTESATRAFSVR